MLRCSHCATELTESARFCSSCGAPTSSLSQMPTAPPSPAAGAGRAATATPVGQGRGFAPGVVLAGRFRIIGLLGRGGMGEVYRAVDLKLGQPVALKFLPEALAGDAALLERFHAEARNARQGSHPNVCRVYDIGEGDGQDFLSMEDVGRGG